MCLSGGGGGSDCVLRVLAEVDLMIQTQVSWEEVVDD